MSDIGKEVKQDFVRDNQSVAEREASEGRRVLHYYFAENEIRHLMGQLLTIVDASISEHVQNKAIKDLMKDRARTTIFSLQEYCFGGSGAHQVNFED